MTFTWTVKLWQSTERTTSRWISASAALLILVSLKKTLNVCLKNGWECAGISYFKTLPIPWYTSADQVPINHVYHWPISLAPELVLAEWGWQGRSCRHARQTFYSHFMYTDKINYKLLRFHLQWEVQALTNIWEKLGTLLLDQPSYERAKKIKHNHLSLWRQSRQINTTRERSLWPQCKQLTYLVATLLLARYVELNPGPDSVHSGPELWTHESWRHLRSK